MAKANVLDLPTSKIDGFMGFDVDLDSPGWPALAFVALLASDQAEGSNAQLLLIFFSVHLCRVNDAGAPLGGMVFLLGAALAGV